MWFKTRAGLVHIEGTVEFTVHRFTRSDGGKSVGVFAFQQHHAEFVLKRLFRPPLNIWNRRVYLACLPEDDNLDRAIVKCMGRIEGAIRNGELICDLSDLGDEEDWGGPSTMILVRWTNP